ncbi:MAG: hypothetical protein DHS20C16_31510 [Phycisphaerae bacterium]|nr:MAG: hypothetical protein DHS20C16_31510 [Phycisphaerae bacterium]
MNGSEQNPAIAVLSQDDTAIERAINDLDSKIAAWVDAMDKASAALAQVSRAEPIAPRAVEDTATTAPVANDAPTVNAAPPKVRAEAPVVEAGPPAEAASGIISLPGGKKSKKPSLKAKPRKSGGGAKSDEQQHDSKPADGVAKKPVKVEKSKEELDAEDEALLAQLDPKVAKSIRIKRRLSRGKKSVREMINELQ